MPPPGTPAISTPHAPTLQPQENTATSNMSEPVQAATHPPTTTQVGSPIRRQARLSDYLTDW